MSGLPEWDISAVKCFAAYDKLLVTDAGDFLSQKFSLELP